MKIGLFGGAFDPFHNGHLAICRAAVKTAGLDRLIVIPTWRAPHKGGFTVGFEDRFNMAAAALYDTDFEVSRYEEARGGVSYSAVTVEDFKIKYPDDELYFLIGADSYRDFNTWYRPERITAAATLLVFPRSGADVNVIPPARPVEMERVDISSTAIRELIRRGESPEKYLPQKVYEYIKIHNLYK